MARTRSSVVIGLAVTVLVLVFSLGWESEWLLKKQSFAGFLAPGGAGGLDLSAYVPSWLGSSDGSAPSQLTSGNLSLPTVQPSSATLPFPAVQPSSTTSPFPTEQSETVIPSLHPTAQQGSTTLPLPIATQPETLPNSAKSPPSPPAPKTWQYLLGDAGAWKCPAGTESLEDTDACEDAATKLALDFKSFDPAADSEPKGCQFRIPDQDVFFNSHDTGSESDNPGRQTICRGEASAAAVPSPPPAPPAVLTTSRSDGLAIFCFAWTPRRKFDEELLPEVRRQFAKCDGHIFFTDSQNPAAEDPGFAKVDLPPQKVTRDQGGWLYHRNMVGLMPSWNYLLQSGIAERFDWFINTELDHFLSPARARTNIASYLKTMKEGSPREQASLDGPIMLMWGNAFVFNKKLVLEMRTRWDFLGQTASSAASTQDEVTAVGCPLWMKGHSEWPQSCSQDVVYPTMAWDILPKQAKLQIATPGDPGCGHPAKNGKNQDYTLGCWEMQQNPAGGQSLEGEMEAIRILADMEGLEKEAGEAYCAAHPKEVVQKNCKKFFDGRHVAVIHHVSHLAVHRLARELLDKDSSSPAPGPSASPGLRQSSPEPEMPPALTDPSVDAIAAANMTLFCFSWSPRRKYDEGMLHEVRKQYKKCDGHLFFTDTESPVKNDEEDFQRVKVPEQKNPRSHGQWLYHRNMVGLMPAMTYMLESGIAEKYDWYINTEIDHFLSPRRARENIAAYLRVMDQGTKEEKAQLDGPIMLMWGNAFVFNRELMKALKQNWDTLNIIARADSSNAQEAKFVGCPMFMKGRTEWPDSCSQDIIYPTLAMNILPPLKVKVAFPGAPGCGQPAKNRKGKEYPLGCWEMQQNPINGESEAGELQAIKELARMGRTKEKSEAKAHCKDSKIEGLRKNCMKFWDGRNVPVIHHLHAVSEHILARHLLDNDESDD